MLISPKASKTTMAIDKPILIKTMHCDSCLVSSRERNFKGKCGSHHIQERSIYFYLMGRGLVHLHIKLWNVTDFVEEDP